ncbi:nucleotidyl transferase AbiEii/AbiGii toxin family protein [Trinickia sp. EG282A]|uniref:nucleotidyl transferase AbiEii/AbiGii toxin family protein n=1 Tax=Trinickia sp. EG282A TaxID=3237013 RepID=UPI0034D16384
MALRKEELMPGPWQQLLPQALALTDEISKHGGVTNPFFTFGGGTVLMLRYEHRFSKDIDIFVPDPQSLNYVNPRLSDVAEEVCNAQYIEAANFVKLILEEGEIDFVASPNLLPDDKAFERWELCGRQVRVETAAEIVAKKMYHRGALATARDLFDLAMVIEREPEALTNAIPFMRRHLEVFRNHLRTATSNFITQFNSIQRLNYDPTFEHAAEVAINYLDSLPAQ